MQTNNQNQALTQLDKYANPERLISTDFDQDAPLSFKNWYASFKSIIPNQEYQQYNQYLISWYTKKPDKTTTSLEKLRLKYLNLLNGLQIYLTDDEKQNWYNQVNLNDEKELLLAIPFFAKKLKNIALYYLRLRKNLKNTKLKYNIAGSPRGIVQELKEIILSNYSKIDNSYITVPANVWNTLPDLSAIKDSISVEIEDVYDDHQYFDRSVDVPLSAYIDTQDITTDAYFKSKGLSLSSLNWAYEAGTFNLSSDNLVDFSSKYLAESKFNVNNLVTNVSSDFYTVDIANGTNVFYYPYGAYVTNATSLPIYKSSALSSANIETLGVAGSSIDTSDTIFVETNRGIQGAWLNFNDYDVYENLKMHALLNGNQKTIFRFPFIGYGLSGDGLAWTGPSLSSDPSYDFLNVVYRKGVETEYWNSDFSLSAVELVAINNATLVDSGAYPNVDYKFSDKIRMWDTPVTYDASTYTGEVQEAWLYKVTKTELSIISGSNTTISWPYLTVNNTNVSSVSAYPDNNTFDICASMLLSTIYVPYATASDSLSSADVIYKVPNYQSSYSDALEAAWLSGDYIQNGKVASIKQNGFTSNFASGLVTRFAWTGEPTSANTAFKSLLHENNCPYLKTLNAKDHTLCKCRQVQFTPFGHNGNIYTDFGGFGDFIAEDTFSPNEFDLNNWKGLDGNDYQNSIGFTWFKTNEITPNWGNGSWVSTNTIVSNKTFTLETGKSYVYYRTTAKLQDLDDIPFPDYVVRYPFNTTSAKWIKALKDANGNWYNAKVPSNMQLNAGDVLLYEKAPTSNFTLSGLAPNDTNINLNGHSIWSTYDLVVMDQFPIPTVNVAYPVVDVVNASALQANDAQYPTVALSAISSLNWTLIDPSGVSYNKTGDNTTILTFSPTVTGTYNVTLIAGLVGGGSYIFTQIPAITSTVTQTYSTSLTSYNTPVPGFVLATNLYGWNYNTYKYDGKYLGARPIWVKGFTDKSIVTGNNTVESWGTIPRVVDIHNIVTQPIISDMSFHTGVYVEYQNNDIDFTWDQPVTLKILVNSLSWNKILINDEGISNLATISNVSLINASSALNVPSDITLSNFVDNKPVRVYYNALGSFTWDITANREYQQVLTQNDFSLSSAIVSQQPWANLTNRNYPSLAILPTLQDIYTEDESGGYFIPNNLGTSVYTGKNYTYVYDISSSQLSNITEDATRRIGGRGLSKTDQPTPYKIIKDDNTWMKNLVITGQAAGDIKKTVSKQYQKFIPYQSSIETHKNSNVGLITPNSKQSPWGGVQDSQWVDINNHPVNFAGQVNVPAWEESQVLKKSGNQLDVWCSDIFGNQYGLYKNIKNVSPVDRKEVFGELWTRANNQIVKPAMESLSSVFLSYSNSNLYAELSTKLRNVDVFYDTIMFETSGVVIFEKLNYDYTLGEISSNTNKSNFISLALPIELNLNRELSLGSLSGYDVAKTGETWFFPEEKKIIISVAWLSSGIFHPELYSLDLNTHKLIKTFPVLPVDVLEFEGLQGTQSIIDRPVISYNYNTKEYVYSTIIKNVSGDNTLVEVYIENLPTCSLREMIVYNILH